ncbi:MAG: hypothetical protein GTO12_16165 [Proteobacteria bacterium]|nr:hypothetical protein [Pseudomonadota bacterium]
MKEPRVVVGGVVETSIAYNLTRNGVTDVTLLEKDFLGKGETNHLDLEKYSLERFPG